MKSAALQNFIFSKGQI